MTVASTIRFSPIPADPGLNALSIDVECWEQIICRKLTGRLIAPSANCHKSTLRVLSILGAKKAKATFFVLGYVAQAFPDLVRRIEGEGHEVASHGFSHTRVDRLSPREFREDLSRSLDALNSVLERPVIGFRAPEFSLVEQTMWAMEALAESGLKYDSSVFPIKSSRYGVPWFPPGPTHVEFESGSILEASPSVARVGSRNLPVAGGGYFRLMPYGIIRRAVEAVHRDARPFVAYAHPYEFDPSPLSCSAFPEQPSRLGSLRAELRFNLFRSTLADKLERLLDEYAFSSIKNALDSAGSAMG